MHNYAINVKVMSMYNIITYVPYVNVFSYVKLFDTCDK